MEEKKQKHPGGRLRVHDRAKIAMNLIEWAQKPDSINLNHFCAIQKLLPSTLHKFSKEDQEIGDAYDYAKACIAYRREEWLNCENLHVKAYDLNATVYDYFLRLEKREQAAYESGLKKEELSLIPPDIAEKYNAMIKAIKEIQDSSTLKMETKSIKSDT